MIRFSLIASLLFLNACMARQVPPPPTEIGSLATMSVHAMAAAVRTGEITSEDVVTAYLSRIEMYDRSGPRLQSLIAVNKNALSQARALDEDARRGAFRGALHGIPVLIKDNIETRELPTTAGSLALIDNDTGRDATIVAKLRQEGAIILGKTNLSEWANFRSNRSVSGWSGVGGLVRNPHNLKRSPCGSSAGSAVAIAAFFAPIALGTETNGSITCPAAMNGIVGFKPTVGLLSRRHIVPLSPRQDTAGPMARTVKDAALMLTVMAGTDLEDPATVKADAHRVNYNDALVGDIKGMRIGVFRWAEGNNPFVSAAFNDALEVLAAQGAVLVDIESFEPDPVMFRSGDRVLRTEYKHALNAYLATAAPDVSVRSLASLIDFNEANKARELALFDQSILVQAAQSPGIEDPAYLADVAKIQTAARAEGIDKLLQDHDVQLLIMPSAKPAVPVDITFSSRPAGGPIGAGWLAAMAGYPVLSVPMGDHMGLPLGLMIIGTAWDDARVLRVGHIYQTNSDIDLEPSYADGLSETPEYADLLGPADIP